MRGATDCPGNAPGLFEFQLTHLLRGATGCSYYKIRAMLISTHAPLARCDPDAMVCAKRLLSFQLTHLLRGATKTNGGYRNGNYFNSRTSCEVRRYRGYAMTTTFNFNSRTSCEVRHDIRELILHGENFNSRTSCEVRRDLVRLAGEYPLISTHAPLARCDFGRE